MNKEQKRRVAIRTAICEAIADLPAEKRVRAHWVVECAIQERPINLKREAERMGITLSELYQIVGEALAKLNDNMWADFL